MRCLGLWILYANAMTSKNTLFSDSLIPQTEQGPENPSPALGVNNPSLTEGKYNEYIRFYVRAEKKQSKPSVRDRPVRASLPEFSRECPLSL